MLITVCLRRAADMPSGWAWATWIDPLAYAVQALIANEFAAPRWNVPYEFADPGSTTTLGEAALNVRHPSYHLPMPLMDCGRTKYSCSASCCTEDLQMNRAVQRIPTSLMETILMVASVCLFFCLHSFSMLSMQWHTCPCA